MSQFDPLWRLSMAEPHKFGGGPEGLRDGIFSEDYITFEQL
jgi:hypothetical protein